MSIRILRPGLLTTVQDLGRWGKTIKDLNIKVD